MPLKIPFKSRNYFTFIIKDILEVRFLLSATYLLIIKIIFEKAK